MQKKEIFLASIMIFLFAAGFKNISYAGENGEVFYRTYDRNFAVQPFISRNLNMLDYKAGSDSDSLSYTPNVPMNAGIALSWNSLSLSATFGIDSSKDEEHLDSKSSDFQFYYYEKKVMLGGFYQKYEGFYLDEGGSTDRPDIKVMRLGLSADYIFNENFSGRAAFNQTEKQVKSSGSFIAGLGIYYNNIEADYSFDNKNILPAPQKIETWQAGPAAGYGYTQVIKNNFYLTGLFTFGLNASFVTMNGEKKAFTVLPNITPRVAMGYNNNVWGINLTFVLNVSYIAKNGEESYNLGTGNFNFSFTRRFNLKKNNAEIK